MSRLVSAGACVFGVSFPELLVIMAVALLVFGPEKLPELARSLGKWSADLRRASDGVRREFYNAMYAPAREEVLRAERELRSMREKLDLDYQPHPLCPDTVAKQSQGASDQGTGIPGAGSPQVSANETAAPPGDHAAGPASRNVEAPLSGPGLSESHTPTDRKGGS